MLRTRIKICGITRQCDALLAAQAGADAIGLNFYAPSPRSISVDQIGPIVAGLPGFVTRVALFVDPAPQLVENVLRSKQLSFLQFHGKESVAFCESFDVPYIKALKLPQSNTSGSDSVTLAAHIAGQASIYSSASLLLLDTYVKGMQGGTGESFDWSVFSQLPQVLRSKLMLAGGLDSTNVAQGIALARPYAVDVSSGVEDDPGLKSIEKVNNFCHQVSVGDLRK